MTNSKTVCTWGEKKRNEIGLQTSHIFQGKGEHKISPNRTIMDDMTTKILCYDYKKWNCKRRINY